jgi:transcriptional regulator with XRE-family HTH domain
LRSAVKYIYGFIEAFSAMTDLKKSFGKQLRRLRRQKDMTQDQLAEAVGVSLKYIGFLERGVNSPSFEVLQKLAEVLEVPVGEFFLSPDDEKKKD